MPLRIVLVRHGLSTFNLDHRIQGRDDLSSLTEEGFLQSRRCGSALTDLSFATLYSSPLRRARDTAFALLEAHGQDLSPQFDEDLLEIDLEAWSGLHRQEVRQRFPEQDRLWRTDPASLELQRADGSRFRPLVDLMEQARRFCDRLLASHAAAVGEAAGVASASPHRSVLVVAHNAILRCVLLNLLGLDAGRFRRLRLDNASLSVLNLGRSPAGHLEVQLESLNGISHLGVPVPPRGSGPRLLLVRHGETDWNREGRFQGQIDVPLNAGGRAQAAAARDFLAPIPIQRAFSSSMARPRQTAETILSSHPGVPLITTSGLREIAHGLWEGRLEAEIAEGWPQLLADWKRAPDTVQMPEGESIEAVWERSLATWKVLVRSLDPDETALVVAHDAVNKTILCALLGLRPSDIWTIKQGNGSVTVIDYPSGADGPAVVSCLNLTHHLGGVLDRTAAGAL